METESDLGNLEALKEVASKRTDGVLIVDLEAESIFYANATVSSLLDINTGDGLRKIVTLYDSVAANDRHYVKSKYYEVRKKLTVSGIEFRLVNHNGKEIWLNCETVLIQNNKFAYVVIRDISRVKEHENYLAEFAARKNTLLDTLGHQLSGALSLTNNLASKASSLKGKADQDSIQTLISLIYNNSQHSINIIDDLLRRENKESPDVFVKRNRIDVVKHVNYIFEELKRSDHRQFVFQTNTPVIYVATDDVKLLQVVNIFTSNSMKFTRPGDEIRLSVEERPGSIVISVADTGIGIPKSIQPFVFEKYGPAGRTGIMGEKSNGLGLSIAKNLATLLEGRIWFKSEEGKGSEFFIELKKD